MRISQLIKHILPHGIVQIMQNRSISGRYRSFDDALSKSRSPGYSAGNENLIEHVKSLEAGGSDLIWAWVTLSGLLASVLENKESDVLEVVDWGGGYGETYFQLRAFLQRYTKLKWTVVELSDKAEIGNKQFSSESLHFISVDKFESPNNSHTLLLGGVLQYIAEPYAELEKLAGNTPRYVIIDRTPVHSEGDESDRFYIQRSPKYLGGSVHPLRILSLKKITMIMQDSGYELVGFQDGGSFPRSYSKGKYYAQVWKMVSKS